MINIEVNNRQVQAKENEMLLVTLRREGIHVPTMCHLEDLSPSGACRLCVVEVAGHPNLVPSCSFPVYPDMKVQTHSPRALKARKTIIELLLSNHPDDCLYCERNNTCQLRLMAEEMGVRARRFRGEKNNFHKDISSPSIVRDPAKCVLCGKCVRICEEVQAVAAIDFTGRGSQAQVGPAFNEGLNVSSCVNCGQCIRVCPTGALVEHSHLAEVEMALNDPEMIVVAQHAPAISVTLAELFGDKPGRDVNGALVTLLRKLGFDRVFDTSFSADLTIMEEGSELVHRIKNGGVLPMMTTCSPGWIKYVEQTFPDLLPNLSTCRSPQQMLGALIKSFYAEREGIDPSKIYSVSIMPCTAKKFEAERPEFSRDGLADVDAVLTTRELAQLARRRGLNLADMEPEVADNPLGSRSTAGKLFGGSGGVMEAALRSAFFLLTGRNLDELKVQAVRGLDGVKEATIDIDGLMVNVAVVSGLENARVLLEEVRAGRKDLHFIEVMTCPGGCINGGGQPIETDIEAVKARMKLLYQIDRDESVRLSHENKAVQQVYQEFLGEPLSELSHKLLHTHYDPREVLK
ncbi:MAG: 4Fe-4S dicluster domain-containing protein [bacterium]|nr:4Fe-4S dicluster domain-containing protein [bacterium]